MARQYDDECKKSLSHQARMFWALFKRASQSLQDGENSECRQQCHELIQDARLPRRLRCSTYHLLACASRRSKAKYWLDLALEVIEEIAEEGKKEDEPEGEQVKYLREKNETYRQLFSGDKPDTGKGDDGDVPDAPSCSERTDRTNTDD